MFFVIAIGCVQQQSKLPEWILGNWQANVNGVKVTETWEKQDNKLHAKTTTYYDKNTQLERVKLSMTNDTLFYSIKINERSTTFVCGKPYKDTLIFENPNNEFPKRIVYVKPDNNKMPVWIENFEGDPNRIDYPFKKIN